MREDLKLRSIMWGSAVVSTTVIMTQG